MIIEKQGAMATDRLEELRAAGKVRRYDCNPLVEVFETEEGVYSIYQKSPGIGGDAWMHLVVGEEKAMLIDTGFGIGDLKALVETLTDKPYYTAADVVEYKDYEVVPVEAGFTFDLGGGEIMEVIHLPGHSAGCAGLVDHKRKIFFSGDSICGTPTFIFGQLPEGPYSEYMTIRGYRKALAELAERLDEFDVLYPGHALLGVPNEIITDTIKVCDAIIANPDEYDDILHFGERSGFIRKIGWGSIAFSKERI